MTELPAGTGKTMRPSAPGPAAASLACGVAEVEAVASDGLAVGDLDVGLDAVELGDGVDRPPAIHTGSRRIGIGSGSMICALAAAGSSSSAASAVTMIRDRERMVVPLCGVHGMTSRLTERFPSRCAEAPCG